MRIDHPRRRDFITLLSGAAAHGRLRRARSRRANCRPSGCLSRARLHLTANGSPHWFSDCTNSVGSRIAIEYRWAEGRGERYAEIAAEFVRLKVDVIVTTGPAAPQAKQATSVIPIVLALSGDPVGAHSVPTQSPTRP
jgi:putative ABC transport system substrate-binding protein